jgi:translation initiation factor 5A
MPLFLIRYLTNAIVFCYLTNAIVFLSRNTKMSVDDSHDFDQGDSGSSQTYPQQCSALRKNGHVVIKGHPCKIVEMSTSKTGKHGHAKVHLVALDIFTGKKYEDICPSTHNMNVPNVSRQDYQLTNIDDQGFLSLMNDGGDQKEDLRLPDNDLGTEIKKKFEDGECFQVTVLTAMGDEAVVATKNMKD